MRQADPNPFLHDPRELLASWRAHDRLERLELLTDSAAPLRWSPGLLRLVLEELHVEDEFISLMGQPNTSPERRYPQAVAVAVALRRASSAGPARVAARAW